MSAALTRADGDAQQCDVCAERLQQLMARRDKQWARNAAAAAAAVDASSDGEVSAGLAIGPGVDAVADCHDGDADGWAEPFEVGHVSKVSRELARARAALERVRFEERRAKDKAEGLAKLIDKLVAIRVVHGDTPVRLRKAFSVEVLS
jgi:hypothetical protein